MAGRTKANDFLRAMNPEPAAPIAPVATIPTAPPVETARSTSGKAVQTTKAKASSRDQLKHFGGYVADETQEKIAILRARLKLDNSELITLAIDELFRKHAAKRAFGDE
jgi:hypothetical protein